MMNLDQLRDEIDRIDAGIVDLLHRRAACVQQVGQLKKQTGAPLFVPERESALFEKLRRLNGNVLPEASLESIYRQIVSCAFKLEGGFSVAYLGPEGTWSHQAARARFGDSIELIACPSFRDVFRAVEKQQAQYGVVPIENSSDGSVSQAMDLFSESPLRICAQIRQEIRNCLLCNGEREKISKIYSHPQVLGQCRLWLRENFPGVEQIAMSSTSAAALRAAEEAEQGAAALERVDWAERFWGLGFRMDCGHSYEERYGIALHDVRGLRRELSRIDDVQTLGDACFSQCRYITHWAMGPCDDPVEWLGVALARLEELAGGVELVWDDEADAWRRAGDR